MNPHQITLKNYNFTYDTYGNLHRDLSYKEYGELLHFYSNSIYIGGKFWSGDSLPLQDDDLANCIAKEESKVLEIVILLQNTVPGFDKVGKLLELGCGIGSFMYHLINSNLSLVGCDISKFALQSSLAIYGKTRFDIKMSEIFELPNIDIAEEKWDYIVCFDFLEHIKCDNLLLEKLKKMLIGGGKLVLEVPIFDTADLGKLENEEFLFPEHHIHLYCESGLDLLFQHLNLRLISKKRIRDGKKILYILDHP